MKLYIAGSGFDGGAGWAWVIVGPDNEVRQEGSGSLQGATSYRAELLAMVNGLQSWPAGRIAVCTANDGLRSTATSWRHTWRERGWRKRKGAIEHLDLVQALDRELERRGDVEWPAAEPSTPGFRHAKAAAREAASEAKALLRATISATCPPARPPAQAPASSTDADAVTAQVAAPRVEAQRQERRPRLVAWTDGGCRGNPGPGGWGFILVDTRTGVALERRGGERLTTNNRMELRAAVEALLALLRPGQSVEIRTDSAYLIQVAERWLAGWKRRGWQTANGDPVKNRDVIEQLDGLLTRHQVSWRKVRGHSGDPGNDWVDALANRAMDALARGGDGVSEQRHRVAPVFPVD